MGAGNQRPQGRKPGFLRRSYAALKAPLIHVTGLPWQCRLPRRSQPATPRRYTFSLALHFLLYRLGLRKQIQVVGATGLGISSGHIEASEGVRADHRTRAFAVDVKIADV